MKYTPMARSSPHFVKVFFPELCSEYLKIPPAFRVHLENESLGMVSLRGPSGKIWDVELVDSSNGLRFESGWKEFVVDHAMEIGDFLVFRLEGCSCFSVLVFDATACEKEVAFLAMPSCGNVATVRQFMHGKEEAVIDRPHLQDIDTVIDVNNDWEEVQDSKPLVLHPSDVPVVEKKKMRSVDCLAFQGSPLKEACIYPDSLKSKQSKTGPHVKAVAKTSTYSQSSRTQSLSKKHAGFSPSKQSNELLKCLRLLKSSEVCRRGEVVAKVQKMPALLSQRRPVTKEEVYNALRKAKSFKSKNPFFHVVMYDSHVYTGFFLNVPSSFARLHLPKISQRITLWDENGKPWKVTYVCCSNCGGLSGGWGAFSFTQNLEKHDVCVFELIKRSLMKVHIFRVVDKITPLIQNFRGES
uniref:TF-B3 domain-containing protein n=2 Tax=Musa acuminata subsp. malaccensis TaxID=214687 RepID=A0A804I124_MUSAM|nr:PREDICTED: B3 domain-containing protein Os11g0197600-like isoform X1 [Musa acuminata subsp. malaccensis]